MESFFGEQVRNGESEDGSLIGRFCGSNMPAPIQSSGRSLFLKFGSDGSVHNLGFLANYVASNTQSGSGVADPSAGKQVLSFTCISVTSIVYRIFVNLILPL